MALAQRTTSRPSSRLLRITAPLLLITAAACGGGGGGGGNPPSGGGDPAEPPMSVPAPPFRAGIVAAAAGDGEVRLDYVLAGGGLETALFRSNVRSTVYANLSAPFQASLGGTTLTRAEPNGTEVFFGLGVRDGGGDYVPVGAIVRLFPRAPIYVDAASTAMTPDGTTPATAFPSLFTGLLNAFVQSMTQPLDDISDGQTAVGVKGNVERDFTFDAQLTRFAGVAWRRFGEHFDRRIRRRLRDLTGAATGALRRRRRVEAGRLHVAAIAGRAATRLGVATPGTEACGLHLT